MLAPNVLLDDLKRTAFQVNLLARATNWPLTKPPTITLTFDSLQGFWGAVAQLQEAAASELAPVHPPKIISPTTLEITVQDLTLTLVCNVRTTDGKRDYAATEIRTPLWPRAGQPSPLPGILTTTPGN